MMWIQLWVAFSKEPSSISSCLGNRRALSPVTELRVWLRPRKHQGENTESTSIAHTRAQMQKDTFTCKTHRTDVAAKVIQGPSQPVLGVSLPADQRRLSQVTNTSQVSLRIPLSGSQIVYISLSHFEWISNAHSSCSKHLTAFFGSSRLLISAKTTTTTPNSDLPTIL